MQIIGGVLFLYGAAAFVMQYLEKSHQVVDWMGNWGPNVGMGIRAAFVVIGIVLFILGRKPAKTATA